MRTVKDILEEVKDKNPEMPIGEALSSIAKMTIYDIYERECDKEDCIGHLTDNGYEAATKDRDFMDTFVSRYRHKFDYEYGTWDNIDSTIFYFQEELKQYKLPENRGNDENEIEDSDYM